MHINVKSRWAAFGIHLLISATIFVALVTILLLYWYPGVFIEFGGYEGITLIAGVDLVLGPILTLAIYNPKKRLRLIKIDLAVISIIQLSALGVGVWFVYHERPIVQVLSDNGLHVKNLSAFKFLGIDLNPVKELPGTYPKFVFLELPETREDRIKLRFSSLQTGYAITLDTRRYRDAVSTSSDIINSRLEQFTKDEKLDCHWMRIIGTHNGGSACVNSQQGVLLFKE
jgi:hypothetical protein